MLKLTDLTQSQKTESWPSETGWSFTYWTCYWFGIVGTSAAQEKALTELTNLRQHHISLLTVESRQQRETQTHSFSTESTEHHRTEDVKKPEWGKTFYCESVMTFGGQTWAFLADKREIFHIWSKWVNGLKHFLITCRGKQTIIQKLLRGHHDFIISDPSRIKLHKSASCSQSVSDQDLKTLSVIAQQ